MTILLLPFAVTASLGLSTVAVWLAHRADQKTYNEGFDDGYAAGLRAQNHRK